MSDKKIQLGGAILNSTEPKIDGGFVQIDGEKFYKISNYDHMADFFMTIVSDSNHFMFLSSNGSLTAGRKNRDNSLFPYYTDDKIHDYCGITGSNTVIIAEKGDRSFLWEPFSKELSSIYNIERNLYKSIYGDKIVFEEINNDLQLSFKYGWYSSDKYGFVKKSAVVSLGTDPTSVSVLDGIQNILPSGLDYAFQNQYSNLLDGYKKNELVAETELGLFMLSSIPVDRAEPSESLNATTVWTSGLPGNQILISNKQLGNFRKGLPVTTEHDIRATRGAFYVSANLNIEPGKEIDWIIVAEINQSTTDVANLNLLLNQKEKLFEDVLSDIEIGTDNLIKIVAAADGIQKSSEELGSARHFSNTLFNVMRGGIYLDNYLIEVADLKKFVTATNKRLSTEITELLKNSPNKISHNDLISQAGQTGNSDLLRVCYEYLPLTFSRRHGDPSRPWNQFSIDTKNENGSAKSDFQGNWRDIFQNWEALCLSYPEFIENIISKFVNASTPDGYNPYRIMRDGIDWESPDPEDPWAYIGYWGDHQIIYLQKLCELSENYHPGKLDEMLSKEIFAYANVPYRIKGYTDIVKNPQDTIEFDSELNDKIKDLVDEMGADGRLLLDGMGKIYHVNLTEKILVSLLAKLSNFIPEAGIWLNTQRPEWNDANNALVGNGVSMVTLYYIRRFLQFWKDKFENTVSRHVEVSTEVKELFTGIFSLFKEYQSVLDTGFSDEQRRIFTDELGNAGEKYRNMVYSNSFDGTKAPLSMEELVQFTDIALEYMDQSIRVNKRDDGLYHSYNLVSFTEKGVAVRHLYEMLEGQVAALSTGSLSIEEVLSVLDSLKESKLFREDQYSYILYPDRQLPRFVEKNNLPTDKVNQSKLLSTLIEDKNTAIITTDSLGNAHFNGSFRNADVLREALDELSGSKYDALVTSEKDMVLDIYEAMFDHQSFTGRSGTFYAFEGLGSIYWHMVSKLLLAVEECFFKGVDQGASSEILGRLKDHYYEIKAGIGLYKSPELYGAFPTDAYSHTPGAAGVKQPGMTGQVKEDVISRLGELGVRVMNGEITFDPHLLNGDEFLTTSADFEYISLDGKKELINLISNQLAFTICQVPVVLSKGNTEEVAVSYHNGSSEVFEGLGMSAQTSKKAFNRTGEIDLVRVTIVE